MANTVVKQQQFPAGTVVKAYRAAGTVVGVKRREGPDGIVFPPPASISAAETATVASDGTITFTTLTHDVEYLVHGLVNDLVQQIAVDATAGTYTLSYGGATTSALAFDALAATVQAALEALPTVGAGNVLVAGGPGDAGATTPYTITFRNARATDDLPLTANSALLTGSAHTATVSTTTGTSRYLQVFGT